MRRKATAKKATTRGTQGNANSNAKAKENTHLKVVKQTGRPTKTPTGKGLGKTGAKRLGRLLKQLIQDQESPAVKGKASLPKTPICLFKHHIQTKAENSPKTNTAKPASPDQLILIVVSEFKQKGGLSMGELKQTLAAAGCDVTKNSRQVNVVTKRPVNELTVRTTRNSILRVNNKNPTDTKQVRIIGVKSSKPKTDLKQSNTASKSPKGAETSLRQVRTTPKPKGRSHQPKGKTGRAAAKSQKLTGKTRKEAAKSHKLTGKTRKAAAKSHKPKRKTPRARRKLPKLAGKKRRAATNRAAQIRKAPRKTQRARKHRPTQTRHPYKSTGTRYLPRRRLPNTRSRLKTQQRRVARRRPYYY